MWVYDTLLVAIKNTNEAAGATRKSNAAVRTIYSLEVGKRAAPFSRTPGRIYKLATTEAPAQGEASEFPGEGGAEAETPGEGFDTGDPEGMGPMTDAQESAMLFSKRYLGDDGKPIPTGSAGAAEGEQVDASGGAAVALDPTIFGKEYKRLPVRMVLEMDQRHLPRLISECAIRPLQIEVQEVRINPLELMGEGGGVSSISGGYGDAGGGGSLFPDVTGLQEFMPQPNIATVVIQGVIYIFNKPNEELLKPTEDSQNGIVSTP